MGDSQIIKQYRAVLDVTQKQLEEMWGIGTTRIRRLINGEQPVSANLYKEMIDTLCYARKKANATDDFKTYMVSYRKIRGYNVRGLAKKVGVSDSSIKKYEDGDGIPPNEEFVEKWAHAICADQKKAVKLYGVHVRRRERLKKSRASHGQATKFN